LTPDARMPRSPGVRVRDAVIRRWRRFYYERRRPEPSRSEIQARLVPAFGIDLGGAGGFTQAWAAHLRSTPAALWRDAPPVDADALERARRGEVEILKRRVRVSPATDWHEDPFFHVTWPRRYVETLSYRRAGSDIDVLWRLNQMRFLTDYAVAYRATADPAFARAACALVDSWCAANPYLVGANWRSPLEAGTRLVAWSMTLAACADTLPPDEATCERVIRMVLRQADHLARHFSERDVPNNHLIGEAAMLFAFAAYWPVLKDAPEWMRNAEAVLASQAERQILKDGFQYENALNYQCYTLDFFLLYLHARALRGEAPHAVVLGGARAMAEVLLATLSPSGRLPMVGDDSITDFYVLRGWTDGPRVAGRGVAFADLVRPAHARVLADTAWGSELLALRAPLVQSRRFLDAGIDVAREETSHLVFTHGPQHRRLFSHGHLHADGGGFELELDGVPLFIDSGTYLYYRDPAARDYFRSAHAHNTLLVDGVEPMKPVDTFGWETVASAEPLGFGVEGDVVAVASRRSLPGAGGAAFLHTRALVKVGATLLVADAIQSLGSAGSHWAAAMFHTPLAQGSALVEGERVRLTDAARFVRVFEAFGERPHRVEIIDAGDIASQYSRWHGDLQHGVTLRVSVEFDDGFAMVSALRTPDVTIEPIQLGPAEIVCAVESPGRRRIASIRLDPLSIAVGGRVIVGHGKRLPTNTSAAPSSMDWLDELYRGRS
jgi:Heparinase II/III-like protein/Heparinase II/III N-terminus